MSKKPYLNIRQLGKNYGNINALKNLDLRVEEGEFIALIGPSGCGKSTFLRMLAGLEEVTTGSILQDGVDVTELPAEQRDFGIVFQNYALFPNLTAIENVAFGLRNSGLKKKLALQQAAEWLEKVGLSHVSNKLPASMSGGQQQRVALVRALALSPSMLLLDEPLSALDAKVRHRLRGQILELQRELKITTIMVTHDQQEALTMADRIVVMNHGVIEQIGTPQQIYCQPDNEFVADFIGEANFISAPTKNNLVNFNNREIVVESAIKQADSEGLKKLLLRPEHLQLDLAANADLSAELVGLEFMGSTVRLRLNYNNQPLHVDTAADALASLPRIGQLCHLRVDAQKLRAF
ncbi:iron(III) transport system ATP-binding protein [Sinobacterium caligoides]|uniref:Iron(III) transport system ATP-binding protein n=1 Tax=Sinobacterium caligoides TaxID=933926 RepID=A0A3N2E017_9GAMM|nr:ATP-binding cassette domain-containing protein [Sinobacterium caligoides]ROS05424.1 iron(III) transport system ATP-binding protein [Sinobacterium caligoides]